MTDWRAIAIDVLRLLLVGGIGAGLALAAWRVLRWILRREFLRARITLFTIYLDHCAAPARVLLPLLGVQAVLPLAVTAQALGAWRRGLAVLLIGTAAWLLVRALRATDQVISARLGLDRSDNLDARRIHTQMRVIRTALATLIVLGAGIGILFLFPAFRQLGATVLASAGVAGIIVGLAAQKVLANLLAGFQIGFTQPIRLDDVVVVEGEWGRIEEITLTYVVVNIWDQRRLVLPISYFLEKPFTNWTRRTSEILGTIYLYVDYTIPVDEIRRALTEIASQSEHWDGRVCGLQVTDLKEHTVELRGLVSARDSSAAWELRCFVRERLLAYLRDHYPGALPRFRAELSSD